MHVHVCVCVPQCTCKGQRIAFESWLSCSTTRVLAFGPHGVCLTCYHCTGPGYVSSKSYLGLVRGQQGRIPSGVHMVEGDRLLRVGL